MSLPTPYTRVAVVQLAFHPAIVVERYSPLEDPLFVSKRGDSLRPTSGSTPESLHAQLEALRQRVRKAYGAQLLAKVKAVLARCQAWNVRLVVFPEYSIPSDILEAVAQAAGDMVVVAGTHTVERNVRRSGLYTGLGATANPETGQSVCPVLHGGKLLALQPKLNPAVPERESLKPGASWTPVALPEPLPGPLGVLVCLDFLYRESPLYQKHVAPRLEACRFLAVPSLTPHHSLGDFDGKAWEEAKRYGRPVLYCNEAEHGGTSVYVDEKTKKELSQFPERSGLLLRGEEGVIVADVDLGFRRTGESTPYHAPRPVRPVAAATLVYQARAAESEYAQ
ncbi:MAG TPA: hypothetical protein VLQ93_26090, partial [Myxococcaceae bacterium]|nr:hypothetical protein [Myxococcaceae bacterium]